MKFPLLNGAELIKILEKMGFVPERQESSHVFLRHPDGRTTIVAVHAREEIDRGLLNFGVYLNFLYLQNKNFPWSQ